MIFVLRAMLMKGSLVPVLPALRVFRKPQVGNTNRSVMFIQCICHFLSRNVLIIVDGREHTSLSDPSWCAELVPHAAIEGNCKCSMALIWLTLRLYTLMLSNKAMATPHQISYEQNILCDKQNLGQRILAISISHPSRVTI